MQENNDSVTRLILVLFQILFCVPFECFLSFTLFYGTYYSMRTTNPDNSLLSSTPALSRRSFLKNSAYYAIGGGTSLLSLSTAPSAFAIARYKRPADLPKATGLRCVVIGGGWSGLTMAKYLKAQNPLFDVVLIEQKTMFNSTIFSNPWLVNAVSTDFTQFSYVNAAQNNDYLYMQATVIDIDKAKRTVFTDKGTLEYEYLIVAPGIDYDYERLGISDKKQQIALKQNCPASYQNAAELLMLKHKIHDFVGGDFVMSVPKGNYRCMTGPYERACLVADYFKKERIEGKVVLLDQNKKPRLLSDHFQKAFNTLYKDQLSYHTNTRFNTIDPFDKKIDCNHGTFTYEEASIYPPIRASRLLENTGLANLKNSQKEANIDPLQYNIKGSEYIFVTGDARPQPFEKSAYTAYSEAKHVSAIINAHFNDKKIPWQSPQTVSYNMLSHTSQAGIKFSARYKTDDDGKIWRVEQKNISKKASKEISKERLLWGKQLYNDMIESS